MIERKQYLKILIDESENNKIKVLTGLQGVGKSYLLEKIFQPYLIKSGIDSSLLLYLDLQKKKYSNLNTVEKIMSYLSEQIDKENRYYIFIDEIMQISDYEDLFEALSNIENAQIYVTESNNEIITSEMKVRYSNKLSEIYIAPLSYKEFKALYSDQIDDYSILKEYIAFGGMPELKKCKSTKEREDYLTALMDSILQKVLKSNKVYYEESFLALVNLMAKHFGEFGHIYEIEDIMRKSDDQVTDKTLKIYENYLIKSYLLHQINSYDIKKKRTTRTTKFFFTDNGLLGAKNNFERNDIKKISAVVLNELLLRKYEVFSGKLETFYRGGDGKTSRKYMSISFVVKQSDGRLCYLDITSNTPEYIKECSKKFSYIRDSFKKIILVMDTCETYFDEKGVVVMSVTNFLLNENSLDI
ncbi:MAG: ATP-binding protein [Clostridia bacterium]|nr:ATP-binding protein [Clostridia bacterium]